MKLEHVELIIATEKDAADLLELQKKAFKKYSEKYGDFESNPYHMSEKRILFSINYRYGKYYKIINNSFLKNTFFPITIIEYKFTF